jgi:putative peptidoglycan lipid II flippase
LIGYVAADPLVDLMAPGYRAIAGKIDLTVSLTRVMLPFLIFLSFGSVVMGMLNAQHIYGPSAFAPSAFNLVAIVGGLGLAFAHVSKDTTAWGWSLAVVVGGFAQFAVQLPSLFRSGFRFRLRFEIDDDVKRMFKLMTPAVIGLASTQINIIVNSSFASHYPGAVSWLNYAFRLLYLPIGVFGVAIATVSTSRLSRELGAGKDREARATMRQALGLVGFLTLPSAVGLWALGEPLIAMIYQRRAFTAADSAAAGGATAYYAIGLFSYSAVKVLAPIYYARARSHIPLIASALAVAANIGVSYFGQTFMGFRALALGTSAAAWVNVIVLYALLRLPEPADDVERGERRAMFSSLARSLIASLIMGVFAVLLRDYVQTHYALETQLSRIIFGLGAVILSGAVFAAAALLLAIPEASLFTRSLRR